MLTIAQRLAVSGLLVPIIRVALSAQAPTLPAAAGGQNSLQSLSSQSLSTIPLFSASTTATELTVRWTAAPADAALAPGTVPPGNQFDVVGRRSGQTPFVRERDPHLMQDEIVVIAIGADGVPLGWQHVKDPRIIRAESAGADGVLSGQTLRRPLTELVVAVPDSVGATELRIYEPRWTGEAFTLSPLGTLAVNPR